MQYQRKLAFVFAMVAAIAALCTVAAAQQQAVPITIANIRDNIYWTQGGAGGNTGIIVGTTGVIVVDTKTTVESSKEVQAGIANITPKLVDTAIVTHSDNDHVNGLAGFPPGLTIIAQENCKKEMEASVGTTKAAPQDRLPTKTIAKDESMSIDGVRVRLMHWAPAHTSGDLIIYFPDQRVVFGGDLLVTNHEIRINVEKQGSVEGWIENVKGMLALDAETYVTGHGDLMTKDDVKKKLVFIQDTWDKVKTLAVKGKSLDEVKTAMGESTAPPTPNAQGNLPDASLTEAMYNEITKKY
jgi:cyclase